MADRGSYCHESRVTCVQVRLGSRAYSHRLVSSLVHLTLHLSLFYIMKLLMHTLALLLITLSRTTTTYNVNAASIPTTAQNARRSSSQCTPFHSRFEQSDISNSHYASTPFVGVSPQGSYSVGSSGLELYLEKPNHPVKTKDGVNDIVSEGATVNSTFTVQ